MHRHEAEAYAKSNVRWAGVEAIAVSAALAACTGASPAMDAGPRDAGPTRDAGFAISSTRSFSLMTWNVEMFPKTATTARLIGEILDVVRPELVGFEEIREPAAFDLLVEQLEDYDGYRVMTGFLGVGMLYRPDRVRVSNVHNLFENDRYAFPRPPLSADVEILGPDGETRFDFVFIVVHLKAQGDSASQLRRIAAIEQLDVYLRDQLALGGEQDYVVIGDYNDRLTDDPSNNVFLPMLDRPDTYTFLTLAAEREGKTSYIPIPGFLDHILITNDALPEYGAGKTEPLPIETMFFQYLSDVSDHRPVRATFSLP